MTSNWPQILHGVGNLALIQAYQISAKSEPKNLPTNEPFFVVAFKTSDEGSPYALICFCFILVTPASILYVAMSIFFTSL